MHEDVCSQEVDAQIFSPQLLKCSLYTEGLQYPKGFRLPPRYVYDYELEFFVESDGQMMVEGETVPVRKGDVVFRRPGQWVQGVMPYACYLICFDLLGSTGKDPKQYDMIRQQEFQTYYRNPVLDRIPWFSHISAGSQLEFLFDSVLKASLNSDAGASLIIKACILQILHHLYQNARNPLSSESIPLNSHYADIERVTQFIKANIHSKITLEGMGKEAGMSPNHFHKVFTQAMGITPNEYVTARRMEKAKGLLVRTQSSISSIALECGFDNIPYFSTVFKKETGVSPSEFRNRYTRI